MTNNELRDFVANKIFTNSVRDGRGLSIDEVENRANAAFQQANKFMAIRQNYPNDWNVVYNPVTERGFIGAKTKD